MIATPSDNKNDWNPAGFQDAQPINLNKGGYHITGTIPEQIEKLERKRNKHVLQLAAWLLFLAFIVFCFVMAVRQNNQRNEWRKTVDARLEALEKTTPQPGE